MDLLLIILYVFINIFIGYKYYKQRNGAFTPPFILSVMSLGQLLPQLTTIYFHPFYNNELIYRLVFVMITCNVGFMYGFEKGKSGNIKYPVMDFKLRKMIPIILFFSIMGLVGNHMFKDVNTTDWVIADQFHNLGIIGLAFCLCYMLKYKTSVKIYILTAICTWPIIDFAFNIKGSRNDTFILIVMFMLFFTLKYPKYEKKIKKIFLLAFILGCIGSMSISEVRGGIHKTDNTSISGINYWDNFKASFTNSYTDVGMDLGNAAILIENCADKDLYNYGTFLWDGFVFNYVPRRIVGEDVKNSLNFGLQDYDLIEKVCCGTTCTTGYYDAYSAFGLFGFVVFILLGMLYGFFYKYSSVSSLYQILYIFLLNSSAIVATHGIQLFAARVEFMYIVIIPVLSLFIYHHYKR